MRRFVALSLLFSLPVVGLPAHQAASLKPDTLPGYTSADSKAELDLEQRFRAIPEAKRAHENMRFLAAHPHNVGSEAQRQNAEWILAKYKEWGWDAHIEQFDVLGNNHRSHRRLQAAAGAGWLANQIDQMNRPTERFSQHDRDGNPCRDTVQLQACRHVILNRHCGERRWLLENHPNPPPHLHRIDLRRVDIIAIQ